MNKRKLLEFNTYSPLPLVPLQIIEQPEKEMVKKQKNIMTNY